MCPTSATWQDKVRELCDRILNGMGDDAVYVDQTAAMQAVMCCDRGHSHRPGGGHWWTESQLNLLDHIGKVRSPEKGYTSECNAENYMKRLHGYLTWVWGREGQVPAFSAVYSDRIVMFGRVSDAASDMTGFRLFFAQSLLFGEQLGWISPDAFLNSPEKGYIIEIAKIREEFTKYFYSGQMLHPPVISGDNPTLITRDIATAYLMFTSPAVIGAIWEKGDKRLLLIANADEKEHAAEIDILTKDNSTLQFAWDGNREIAMTDGRFALTVPAKKVLCAEF
jgi:hypothetical protein